MKDKLITWFNTLNLTPFIKKSTTNTNYQNHSTGAMIKQISMPNDDDSYLAIKQAIASTDSKLHSLTHIDADTGFIHEFRLVVAPKGSEWQSKRKGVVKSGIRTTNHCKIDYIINPPKVDKPIEQVIGEIL